MSEFKVRIMTKKELAALYGISPRTLSRLIRMANSRPGINKAAKIDYSCSPLTSKTVQQIVNHIGEP